MLNFLLRFLRVLFFTASIFLLLFFFLGQMFWIAISKDERHYLAHSIRNCAPLSVWINQSASSAQQHLLDYGLLNFSLWIDPKKIKLALGNFDNWAQEYALVKDATEEAIDDESYPLPPSVPPDSSDIDVFIDDPYDLALQKLIEDFLNSGFVTISGAAHLKSPIWAKPLMGWLSADVVENALQRVFDTKIWLSGVRKDGADVLSWFSELPFAHLDSLKSNGVSIYESVFDLSGEQLAGLHSRLCELGNLSAEYCEFSDFDQNPLDPFLFLTENFKAQFRVFWTIRGDHLIWASTRSKLLNLINVEDSQPVSCTLRSKSRSKDVLSLREERLFIFDSFKSESPYAGIFVNNYALHFAIEEISKKVSADPIEGASWLFDVLQTVDGERAARALRDALEEGALLKPLWGARLSWRPPERARMLTFAQFLNPPIGDGQIQPIQGEKTFNFLYGWVSAWQGIPRGPGRLEHSSPWLSQETYWRSVSEYSLGWRESE